MVLTGSDLSWEAHGALVAPGVISADGCRKLLDAAHSLLHDSRSDVVVRFEANLPADLPPERRVSKLYRLHRHEPFRTLCTSGQLLDYVRSLIGGAVDVFLSQVVWKVPGAFGQPWHQDSSLFPFEPARPVIGTWLALTRAETSNGCLQVVPGSHREPLRDHGFDRESRTKGRYLSLVDDQVEGVQAVELEAGDVFVFDSHLLHATTDNVSDEPRVALTFHFATAGTTDHTAERFGRSPYNDWMPAIRDDPTHSSPHSN